MPVEGLPTTVETVIQALLVSSGLSSFKIAGNPNSTTIVLRFGAMADHSVASPIAESSDNKGSLHAPLPSFGKWSRKSPSQQLRDHKRLQSFLTSKSSCKSPFFHQSSAILSSPPPPPPRCVSGDHNNTSEGHRDSATQASSLQGDYHSSVTVNTQTSSKLCCATDSALYSPSCERDKDTLSDTMSTGEHNTQQTMNDDSGLENSQLPENNTSVCGDSELSQETNLEHDHYHQHHHQDQLSEQDKANEEAHQENDKEETNLTDAMNSITPNTPSPTETRISSSSDSYPDFETFTQIHDNDKFRSYVFCRLSEDIKAKLKDETRNNSLKKITLDCFDGNRDLICQTDDIVLECDLINRRMHRWFATEAAYRPYEFMRLRHLQNFETIDPHDICDEASLAATCITYILRLVRTITRHDLVMPAG